MTWKSVYNTRKLRTGRRDLAVRKAVQAGDLWVMRDSSHLYAYSPDRNRILWQLDDSFSSPLNTVLLGATPQVAVTALSFGREDKRFYLIGVDPESGQKRWQRRVWWPKRTITFGGVCAAGKFVLFGEKQNDGPRLIWLDALSGEEAYMCEGVDGMSEILAGAGRVYVKTPKQLYSLPLEPGNAPLKLLLEVRKISSLVLAGSHLYGRYSVKEGEQLLHPICWWDAATFRERARMESPPGDIYRHARVVPANPQQPQQALVYARNHLHLMDLEAGRELWHVEQEGHISYSAWTPEGVFFSIDEACIVDEATGALRPAPFEKASQVFVFGDCVLAAGSVFSAQVYAPEACDVPAAAPHEWPVSSSEDIIAEDDVPADPRDDLQREVLKAGTRKKLDAVYKQMRGMFPVTRFPRMVKEFFDCLRRGDLKKGPLNFTSWESLFRHCMSYRHLFTFDIEDRFFPAFQIASEEGGVEFWMMLGTGIVIDLHHDASFYEEARDVWSACQPDIAAFERQFPLRGNRLTIEQLMRFQQAFRDTADMIDLRDLNPEETFQKIAGCFDWSLVELRDRIEDFEYFGALFETHEQALAAILEAKNDKS